MVVADTLEICGVNCSTMACAWLKRNRRSSSGRLASAFSRWIDASSRLSIMNVMSSWVVAFAGIEIGLLNAEVRSMRSEERRVGKECGRRGGWEDWKREGEKRIEQDKTEGMGK